MGEEVFAGTDDTEPHGRTAVAKQVPDDEGAAQARSSAERPHICEATGEPHLSQFPVVQIRGSEGLTIHLHRLEIEANAKYPTQTGESHPPNQ
jgi:hypothetical protein